MVFDYYFRRSKSSNTFTMFTNFSWAAQSSITLMHSLSSSVGHSQDYFVLGLETEFIGFAVSLCNTVNSVWKKPPTSSRSLLVFSELYKYTLWVCFFFFLSFLSPLPISQLTGFSSRLVLDCKMSGNHGRQ